jgi:hypothetical protein
MAPSAAERVERLMATYRSQLEYDNASPPESDDEPFESACPLIGPGCDNATVADDAHTDENHHCCDECGSEWCESCDKLDDECPRCK